MGRLTFDLDTRDEHGNPVQREVTVDDNTEAMVLSNREVVRAINRAIARMGVGK